MNKWKIPNYLEKKIRNRDKSCVYCHTKFDKKSYTHRATWEHIDNDVKNISETNIVVCCASCNSSKGTKSLQDWLNTVYCQNRLINIDTVADIVKKST